MTEDADTLECPKCKKYTLKPTNEIADPYGRMVLKCIDCVDVFIPAAPELRNWIVDHAK